jgi:hypothetical protein
MKANKQNEQFLQPEVIHVKSEVEFNDVIRDRVAMCKRAIPYTKFLIEEGSKYPDIEEMIMLEVVLDDVMMEDDGGEMRAAVTISHDSLPKFLEINIQKLIEIEEYELCCELRDLQAKLNEKVKNV